MNSIPYALFFIFILFTAFLEHRLASNNQIKLVRGIVLSLSIIFFGLRGHILTDFSVYYIYFSRLNSEQMLTSNGLFEPGFIILTFLFKSIYDNYHFWIFISSVIHVFALGFIFKKYIGNLSLGLIFFLGYRGIIIEFNLLQNFLAIILFLLSIPFITKKKFLPYLLLNLLGMTFHITSIIYIPFYFILKKNLSKKTGFIIIIIANLFFFGGSDLLIQFFFWIVSKVLPSNFGNYLYFFVDTSSYGLSFGFLERTFMIILIILVSDRIKKEIPHGIVLYNMSLFYYAFFLLLSPIDVLTDRIPILFLPAFWIIPACLLFFKNRYRPILAVFLITLSFAKLVLSTQDKVAKYDNLLFGIRSYEERSVEVIEHNAKQK
jgi:hypothetical protein